MAPATIDPDWNPKWPVGWQRHYAAVRELLSTSADFAEIPAPTRSHRSPGGSARWLPLMAGGAANADTARAPYLPEGTAKAHVGRIPATLGMRDRVHAVICTHEHRLGRV